MKMHYAMQVCDVANNQTNTRYCNSDRTTLSIKSIKSVIRSIQYVCEHKPNIEHYLLLVDDHSSEKLKSFLKDITSNYKNLVIEVQHTEKPGLMNSVKICYNWLKTNGTGLVYQIQDDYLFAETAITEMIDIFFQLKIECDTEPVISPYNDPHLWLMEYRNRPTPRAVFVGKNRYWISLYDVSCSFMTSINIFKSNWDLLEEFYNMPPLGIDGNLENVTLNKMFVQRGILGLAPINSLALHIQSDLEKDPYIDWKSWWDNIQ